MSDFNNVLLLDIGNTFVHWRYRQSEGSSSVDDLQLENLPIDLADISQVFYAAVADSSRWVHGLGPLGHVQRIRCERPLLELLKSEYESLQLGIDRWLAMLGACSVHGVQDPALIVDVGTAVTFDVLKGGVHRGGWICPGLYTWSASITQHTNIAVPHKREPQYSLGLNTIDAIAHGWMVSMTAIIRQTMADQSLKKLVITGGHGNVFRASFPEADYFNNLVLDGLSVWAREYIRRGEIP